MKLNKSKARMMVIAEDKDNLNIILDNENIEQVSDIQYLDVILNEKWEQEVEINERIEKAMQMYDAVNMTIMNKKEVSKGTKYSDQYLDKFSNMEANNRF